MPSKDERPVEVRFWEKVDKSGSYFNGTRCWEWQASKASHGYGQFHVGYASGKKIVVTAHRFAYELLVGPIPDTLHLDHLCRNRICVNPDHLNVVPSPINTLRGHGFAALNAQKTHCPHGHAYDLFNTHRDSTGHRHCRECWRQRARARRAKG